MFTGIVECTSKVLAHTKDGSELVLTIATPDGWELTVGQSVAVHGVCLTVTTYDVESFSVTLVAETLRKTLFGTIVPDSVNLERALIHGDRLDGHMVQGHVDTAGTVLDVREEGASRQVTVAIDQSHAPLVINKGSVALNGVSLTIVECTSDQFSVVLIPHTLAVTTLCDLTKGDVINIEFDIIGKYAAKQKEEVL